MRLYPTNILAHRGGGTLAPENTLAAIRCGLAHGFHAVEFDVMLSRDGVPMVNHDPELGRTVAGAGKVSDFTAQQLMAMDAGSWYGAEFSGEPVASYEQVWRFCVTNQIWMNVEIKPVPGFEVQTGRAVAALSAQLLAEMPVRAGADFPLLLSSFSAEALTAARAAAPHIPRALLVRTVPHDWRTQLNQLGAVALHVQHDYLNAALAGEVKAAGFGLLCYTVNDAARARELLSWGVDALCTDRIDLIGPEFR